MGKDGKVILGVSLATIAIIGIGAYFLSRTPTPVDETNVPQADQNLLVKSDSNKLQAPQEKAILVEFGDFQCPACASFQVVTKRLEEEFKDNLSFVFRNFPLSQHQNALPSAFAAEAAGKQGKYWEMFNMLYENQAKWSTQADAEKVFEEYAKTLGLNMDKYKKDFGSQEAKDKIDKDYKDGIALGINATPTFYLNGRRLLSARRYEDFQRLVKDAIEKASSPEGFQPGGEDTAQVTGTQSESYHAHFALAVYTNGRKFDFSNSKYQETSSNSLSPDVHFHGGNGDIVHIHKKGVTLDQFFNSLKMKLESGCFTLDNGQKFCQDGEFGPVTLEMYVNGQRNENLQNYVPQDLDRILITYGKEGDDIIKKQIDRVSDEACIYSDKCPERGKPPTEECVGGLGTECIRE